MNEHDSLDHPRPDIGRSPADLASQPKLGLWPKRIVGHRARRSVDTVADGPNLAGSSHLLVLDTVTSCSLFSQSCLALSASSAYDLTPSANGFGVSLMGATAQSSR